MKENMRIIFSKMMHRRDTPMHYCVSSVGHAWRTLPKKGPTSHDDLYSALFGSKGALELFTNNPFARKRASKYGEPKFVAVWIEGEAWSLLIQNRVAAIVPIHCFDELQQIPRSERTDTNNIEYASEILSRVFDHAESHVLVEDLQNANDWEGPVSFRPVDGIVNEQSEHDKLHKDQINFAEEYLLSIDGFEFLDENDYREKTFRSIALRRGQPMFRQQLLEAYNSQCAITNFNVEDSLEAAHIFPYRGDHTNHVTNGLLLRTDIHNLFDVGHIGIDPSEMTVKLSSNLRDSSYGYLDSRLLSLPDNKQSQPSEDAMRWHYENIFIGF